MGIDVREVRWVRIVLNRRLQVLEGKLVLLLGVPRETALVVELRVRREEGGDKRTADGVCGG